MYKVFRKLLTESELLHIENIFGRRREGWSRAKAVNLIAGKIDEYSSRRALLKVVRPEHFAEKLKQKLINACKEVVPGNYVFSEGWSINKYKAEEKGHFYWHIDYIDGFNYQGDKIGKMTPEEIFISNIKPNRAMSISVALNDRSSYNGGQFVIDVGDGMQTPIDLDRGDAVVFDSRTYHGVNDVTEGERLALVIWLVNEQEYIEWKQICLEQGIEIS